MCEINKNEVLKSIYLDPSHPAGFSTVNRLYDSAKKISRDISRDDVISFLQSRDSYTRHGVSKKNYVKRPVLVKSPGHLLAGDLIDMTEDLRQSNNNIRYLLCLIDCYSRYATVFPLEDKRSKTIGDKLDIFFRENHYSYRLFWTDRGSEFVSGYTSKIFVKHGVKLYHVFNNRVKSAYVERFIRTLKSKIYKVFTEKNTVTYYDILPKIVISYNSTPHRGLLGKIPKEVHYLSDQDEIKKLELAQYNQKMLNYNKSAIKKANLKCGFSTPHLLQERTHVRLLLDIVEKSFLKSYKPLYTIEIFEIDKVVEGFPTVYYLKDLQNESISGMVYRSEIKPVKLPETFLVEKVLKSKFCPKTKQTLHLIKFLGYPPKFNTWTSDIESVKS